MQLKSNYLSKEFYPCQNVKTHAPDRKLTTTFSPITIRYSQYTYKELSQNGVNVDFQQKT